MKKLLFLILIVTISFSYYFYNKKNQTNIKNVIVISFCSLSAEELPLFNENISDKEFPNFSQFFNKSTNYTDAHGSTSWLNIGYFIFNQKWFETFKTPAEKNQPIMDWRSHNVDSTMIRVPGERDLITGYTENYTDDRSRLPFTNFDQIYFEIKRRIDSPGQKLIVLHYKIMHYPFLSNDIMNNSKLMSENFTTDELQLIKKYYESPNRYPEKMAFFQFLFGDKKFKKYFSIGKNQYAAFVTIPEEVTKWKTSNNYQADKNILSKAYKLRLKIADDLIGKWSSKFNQLGSNTAIVISGDHGETFGKYDYLSHGTIPYDQVTKFFFSLHFPNQTEKFIIQQQVSQKTLGHLLEDIAQGKVNMRNFSPKEYIKKSDQYIFSYSCAGDIGAVRVNSKWKLIHYFKENRTVLYDLNKDPDEKYDISSQHQDLTLSLKLEIEERLAKRTISSSSCIK